MNNRKKELKEMQEIIIEKVDKALTNPHEMLELLDFLSNFKEYSWKNRVLLGSQGATAVESYKGWKEKGYQVQRGERGLLLWLPYTVKTFYHHGIKPLKMASEEELSLINAGKIKVSSFTKFCLRRCVFDVTQTDFPNENIPKIYANKRCIFSGISENDIQKYEKKIAYILNEINVRVFNPSLDDWQGDLAKGYFASGSGVFLSPRNTKSENFEVLIHEAAHAILHGGENSISEKLGIEFSEKDRNIKEFQAEMTACLVSKNLGMNTENESIDYIAKWTEKGKKLKVLNKKTKEKILDEVVKISDYIIEEVTKNK